MLKEGAVLKDRYRVIGYVGSGGQRRVYRAIDTRGGFGNRDVVIKEMFRGRSFKRDLVNAELTQQEVRILIDFPHPCIPRIHDLFVESGTYYLIQEFIEGKTLKEYIHERKQLGEMEAVNLMLQITDAVDYLHSQNPPIIIRDLKPSNVVVRAGRPFVVDLGGAQSEAAAGTDIENVSVSTRGYAPPEGVRNKNAYTIDVYAAGVMLYQMVTGHDPVSNPGPLPSIRRIKKDVNPELERIVNKAIERDPKRRYPTMLQLELDLEQLQKQMDGKGVPRMLTGVLAPVLVLLLNLAVLGLPVVHFFTPQPWLHVPPPPVLYAQLGVGLWAMLIHSVWRHWFAPIAAINGLARRLCRKKGGIRPITALIALDTLLVLGFLVRMLIPG